MRTLLIAAVASALVTAQNYKDRPALHISSDRLDVTILEQGASVAAIVLRDDPSHLNPLWDPVRVDTAGVGHFVCLDAFGPTSPEELKAGLQFHGEAIRTQFAKVSQASRDGVSSLSMAATLPLVQERVVRSYEVKQGENVLYVRTRVESLVGFDRPMVWAEHGTIGSPYLERESTVVDISASRSQTRPYTQRAKRRLESGKEFTWPVAPLAGGGTVDLRAAPAQSDSGDHTTNLVDMSRPYAFAVTINTKKRLAVGWIWRSADFPWLQNWENYPARGMLARGLEFSTQPFDVSRRDAVAMNPMFGAPTFRWLPAKSAVETTFVLFYTPVPEGFDRLQDAVAAQGSITLVSAGGQRVVLPASLSF